MMQIDPREHDARHIYGLMCSIVVPRPIAWVSTISRDGVLNLAPFSYFNAITSKPPLLSIAVGRRAGAQRKDTAHNASTTRELVINVVTERNIDKMVQTSAEWPPEVDEFERAGLTPLASERVKPPRVAESPIQMECRTREIFEVSPGIVDLVIAEVLLFHVADELPVDEQLCIPADAVRPVARLGGEEYALLGAIQRIPRPKV
jgi:flavin reductase (DIM6/NTAB) family NADH-FMN oxidoreductase RutF